MAIEGLFKNISKLINGARDKVLFKRFPIEYYNWSFVITLEQYNIEYIQKPLLQELLPGDVEAWVLGVPVSPIGGVNIGVDTVGNNSDKLSLKT